MPKDLSTDSARYFIHCSMTIQRAGGPRLCGGRLDLESMFEKILLRSILKCFENWPKKDFNDNDTVGKSSQIDSKQDINCNGMSDTGQF